MGVDIAHHHDIAFDTGIICGGTAPITIRVCPGCVGRIPVSQSKVRVLAGAVKFGDRARRGCQPLQVPHSLVMQFTHGVELLVAAEGRTRSAELVQVIDHATAIAGRADVGGCLNRGVAFGVFNELSRVLIPLGLRVVSTVLAADVEQFVADIFHGRAQHATKTGCAAGSLRVRLVHQIAESGQAQLVTVFLNGTRRLEISIGVFLAQSIIPHILQG